MKYGRVWFLTNAMYKFDPSHLAPTALACFEEENDEVVATTSSFSSSKEWVCGNLAHGVNRVESFYASLESAGAPIPFFVGWCRIDEDVVGI
ncbi:hypothetical protein KDA_34670 [Dictyobacter alpinus]|uniref:Uncharacterized protein n=1 Tax=Dictyobacter alpinus TaxID=2014873 RepID=A0A402B9A2_9CHLR|nr:hypothetical protein KDA_34670 [Dictyobacter alpinus]